jgi:hypothetical protein
MTRSLNGARKRNGIEGETGMIEIFSLRDSMDDDIDMGLVHIRRSVLSHGQPRTALDQQPAQQS